MKAYITLAKQQGISLIKNKYRLSFIVLIALFKQTWRPISA